MPKTAKKSKKSNEITRAEQKHQEYVNKRDLRQELLDRTLNACIDDNGATKHSEGLMLAMKTLMPREARVYAEKKAEDMLSKFDYQKVRETNKNLKMFSDGDNPVHDMIYLLKFGNSLRKASDKKIENYTNDEFIDLATRYLEYCEGRKIQPNVPGLATWCGISTNKLTRMNNGSLNCSCLDGVQMVLSMFQSLDEELASNFKTNGAVHIFNSKNYYGMKDKQTNDININEDDLTKRQKIIDAVPVEYTEIK